MPIALISGPQAIEAFRRNKEAIWPSRQTANRVEPICSPALRPKFRIPRNSKIFAIGSCYVRNVERRLAAHGIEVVTASARAASDEGGFNFGANITNNFGLPSILNEIRWAHDSDAPFDLERSLIESDPGLFLDLHVSSGFVAAPKSEVIARRKAIRDVYARLSEASVSLLTLGVAEVWFDRITATYVSYPPPARIVARYPDRFEVHRLGYSEVLGFLDQIISSLTTYGAKPHRVILEISPIPLLSTFGEQDVIVATAETKAFLRAAAAEASARSADVDYFPSFEAFSLSDRKVAWYDNQHHVTHALIDANTRRFVSAYVDDGAPAEAESNVTIADIDRAIAARNPVEAMRLCEEAMTHDASDGAIAARFAALCLRFRRFEDGVAVLDRVDPPTKAPDILLHAKLYIGAERYDDALRLLRRFMPTCHTAPKVCHVVVEAFRGAERIDEAIALGERRLTVDPSDVVILEALGHLYAQTARPADADRVFAAAAKISGPSSVASVSYIRFLLTQARFPEAEGLIEALASCGGPNIRKAALLRKSIRLLSGAKGRRPAGPVSRATAPA